MLIKENKNMTEAERIAVANTNNSYLQALSYVAVGTIFPFAGEAAPDTFMICDGRELDTAEYTELFGVIGYTFGGSDTTFKLPDLRGRVLVGLDESLSHFEKLGLQGGEPEHALTEEEGPIHTHKPTNTLQGDFAYQFQTVKALNSDSTGRVKINNATDGRYQVITADTQSVDYKNTDDISAEYATAPSGNGKAHNNLQPYTVCNYIIKVTNRFPNVIEIEYADKQDKFADVTEEDGVVTVTSTVSDDRPPQAVFKNGLLELLAMHLQFGDGMGEVSLKGYDAPDDSLNVNVNGNRIRNLANPIFEGDAVNKAYLDGVVGDIEGVLDELHNYAQTLANGGETVWA